MKTATVRDLRNNYKSVLSWVEGGEEVKISRRGKVIARLVPEKPKPQKVDWSQSAAFKLDRSKMKMLTAEDSAAIIAESRGSY
jgi:antitoxin (DNA-binding transcriptional repressor) of toxin-antitoxin stability system